MKKVDEWRELGVDELKVRLNDSEEELANLRFQLGSHQLESPVQVRTARRNVARIMTLIREKELEINRKSGEGKE